MATACGFHDEPPSASHLVDVMQGIFPSVPARRISEIVSEHGTSDEDEIVEELLRISESESSLQDEDQTYHDCSSVLEANDSEDNSGIDEVVNARCHLFRSLLPDADPDFLMRKAVELSEKEDEIHEWLEHAVESHDYPTLVEYLKRKECKDTLELYAEMGPRDFLHRLFAGGDDPEFFYSSKDRRAPSEIYRVNTATLVRFLFPDVEEEDFEETLKKVGGLLVPAVNDLQAAGHVRGEMPSYQAFETADALDLMFVQEMTFLRLEESISTLLLTMEQERHEAKEAARAAGSLFLCPICLEDDILLAETLGCTTEQHLFCTSCIKRQAEVASSEARSSVPCLEHQCPGTFPLSQLQGIVGPSLLNTFFKAVQLNELREAALELEACPFCGFSCEIEDKELEVFRCLNSACRVDSCRKCKKVAHGSIPCEELETDVQTEARLLLEEKLTSAVVRHCPNCDKEVLKVEGCNHMTCICGAEFCYVCRKQIENVSRHYSSSRCNQFENSSAIHERDLALAVQEGKEELQEKFGDVELIHDPTADVELPVEDETRDSSSDDEDEELQRRIERYNDFARRMREVLEEERERLIALDADLERALENERRENSAAEAQPDVPTAERSDPNRARRCTLL